ncbi:hypothetical protein Back2_29420 [Nocardioides baekrokdamisoli]|uniref:Antitoxin Xre/MbcA/ParS-like toxin-binding domain-containing protein n=1 Tax=Nocardioides baekrokdamisoli TaxID=1804624 RepID=A0A3G9IRR0_9ACTN|nr:hypothetical protein [Nocardioides baekrokdamisoli]BBH18655.1 hypothetical protein Back2_29420 [Nocardioides baekrokdamisoli]
MTAAVAGQDEILALELEIRASLRAVRGALESLHRPVSPALVRAQQATLNVMAVIEAETPFLKAGDAGRALGSRSQTPRNAAAKARLEGRVLGVPAGAQTVYPAFQFADGSVLPVIADLRTLGAEAGQDERNILLWLFSPTTYLPSAGRPIDILISDPATVLAVAEQAWNIEW